MKSLGWLCITFGGFALINGGILAAFVLGGFGWFLVAQAGETSGDRAQEAERVATREDQRIAAARARGAERQADLQRQLADAGVASADFEALPQIASLRASPLSAAPDTDVLSRLDDILNAPSATR